MNQVKTIRFYSKDEDFPKLEEWKQANSHVDIIGTILSDYSKRTKEMIVFYKEKQ